MADPVQGIAKAVSAYNNMAQGKPSVGTDNQGGGEDFADLVKSAIREAKAIGAKGENLSLTSAVGQADVNQVVQAVSEAELTLQTVVAVRDKVMEAYNQIIRMPI